MSTVLGKHLPVAASVCRLAGTALALAIAGDPRARDALEALLGGRPVDAGRKLTEVAADPVPGYESCVVVGMAETATALGHQVAEALDAGWFQTSTRHPSARAGGLHFTEAHSHAADQWIRPPAAWPEGLGVLIDDELTTGRTVGTLIELLQSCSPRCGWVVGVLVDARPAGCTMLEQVADRIGVPVRVVSLERFVDQAETKPPGWSRGRLQAPPSDAPGGGTEVEDVELSDAGPAERDGLSRADRAAMRGAAGRTREAVGELGESAIVLGFGEHLAISQLHALANGVETQCGSTTRSPALIGSGIRGYPLRSAVTFGLEHDATPWFAYNIDPSLRSSVVVHFPDGWHRRAGQPFLDALRAAGARRLVAVTCARAT